MQQAYGDSALSLSLSLSHGFLSGMQDIRTAMKMSKDAEHNGLLTAI
jgi:hypothetical protein